MDIAVILIIGISLIAGLFWYQNNIWGPEKKRLLMQRGPLVELEKWGFYAVTDAFAGELLGKAAEVPLAFVGIVGGYATEVSFGWSRRPHVSVRLFFEPGSRDYDEVMSAWRALQANANKRGFRRFFVAPVYADAELPYNFWPPKAEEIIELAERVAHVLHAIGKKPLAYAGGCELATAILATSLSRNQAAKQ